MSNSSSESSDDDVGKLIARTKQQYAASKRPREDDENDDDESDDSDSQSLDDNASSDSSVQVMVATAASSKLEELQQRRRIRERSAMLANNDDDSQSSYSSQEEDGPSRPARKSGRAVVDKNKINVSVKVCREEDVLEVLSSDDDDEAQKLQNRKACFASKELQAIQAARDQLSSAQRYKSTKAIASPSLSPVSRRLAEVAAAAVEECTLTIHCKLMLHGKVQDNKIVPVTVWNTSTLSLLHEELLKACDMTENAAIISTLTFDDRVIGKSASALSKLLTVACPTIQSGSVLHATLHLTGLQSSNKASVIDIKELEKKKYGRSLTVNLRRMIDRKEEREEWKIREREPMSNLASRYFEKHKVEVRLEFDGETVGADSTPANYDMEDGDLIDVVQK